MYSILIYDGTAKTWSFHKDADEAVYVGTLAETQDEVKKLLNTVTLNKIKVVHNTTLTANFTIADVTE